MKNKAEKDIRNLLEFCYNATLVVLPKKDRAVTWYNHFVEDDGWLCKRGPTQQ